MPEIRFGDLLIRCEPGENLRRVLMQAGTPLYNGLANAIHCRGLGTCGTCSLSVRGEVSPMTRVERWRLSFPPHRLDGDLRLACQCQVLGDLVVQKHAGLWGHRVAPRSPPSEASSQSSLAE